MGAELKNKLWTRDFSIITIGSIISMLGNAVSGFAIGLVVLDYTKSTFLYAFFMVMYSLPQIIVPLIAGPYLDKYSRKKVIYTLDFLSSFLFMLVFLFMHKEFFNYYLLIVISIIMGTIDGIYQVAYESFYPNLISEGNYSKAYSISSMIYPLSECMVPVAALIYNKIGTTSYLFLFNSLTFFIAACFETRIKYKEEHMNNKNGEELQKSTYKEDFKEGLNYIKVEKGLLVITVYFCLSTLTGCAAGTVLLPFFKNNPQLFTSSSIDVVTLYTLVMGAGINGRLIGGFIHYKFKYPKDKKFLIAIIVYTSICFIEGGALFMPISIMMLCYFTSGIMGVTSFNIRISATQSYVPDNKRGRFNGIFQMVCVVGGIIGQLLAGAMAEFISERRVVVIFMIFNLLAVIFIMYRGRNYVKEIYNRDV